MKNNLENFEKEKKWILEEKYENKKEIFLNNDEKIHFQKDIQKLQNNEPLAYIIGNMPFLNCKIDLEFKPLIPRSETEFWVNNFIENDLKKWNFPTENSTKNTKKEIQILDIFSGSGCIGISILKNFKNNSKNIFVDFAEINPLFIKQIEKNISLNIEKEQENAEHFPAQKKWKIFKSDIFSAFSLEKKWDFILANPPYIPKNKKIDNSVLDFEDFNSLFADENGLYFVKKIVLEGLEKLQKKGKIIIEFDETSKEEIENFLKKENLKKYIFKKDQFDNWRTLEIWN